MGVERDDNKVPNICPVPSLDTPFHFQIKTDPCPSLNPRVHGLCSGLPSPYRTPVLVLPRPRPTPV